MKPLILSILLAEAVTATTAPIIGPAPYRETQTDAGDNRDGVKTGKAINRSGSAERNYSSLFTTTTSIYE